MNLNDPKFNVLLDAVRTELTDAVTAEMTALERHSYLHQIIYNKYASMGAVELLSECEKVLDEETNLAIKTAFRFEEWKAKKYS